MFFYRSKFAPMKTIRVINNLSVLKLYWLASYSIQSLNKMLLLAIMIEFLGLDIFLTKKYKRPP